MAKKEMDSDLAQDKAMIKKAFKEHDAQEHPGKHTKITLKKGGMPMKKMAKGGLTNGGNMQTMGRNLAKVANQGGKK